MYDLYDVESLDDILGNEQAIARMRRFCSDVNKGIRREPLLVFGPAGTGKSMSVHLLAKENTWNVVELNASDYRDKDTIENRLISAATSRPLLGKRNLILLDEIDELASRFDKGAGSAITNLINQTKNPIIFIANDIWDKSVIFLRGRTETIEFKRLAPDTVHKVLSNLCGRFSIRGNATSIQMISNRANGDARSAINDMSAIIDAEDEDTMEVVGLRDRKIDIFNTLDKIFLTNTLSSSLRAIMGTDIENDMLIKWIDENIPRKYSDSVELRAAFDSLAYASMFYTRATRAQYYIYWRYMNVLMSGGVALSKTRYPEFRRGYSFPKVIKELSSSKASRNQRKAIAAKLQRVFHTSIKRIIKDEMPMLSSTASSAISGGRPKKEVVDHLAATYLLDGKEIEYILALNS